MTELGHPQVMTAYNAMTKYYLRPYSPGWTSSFGTSPHLCCMVCSISDSDTLEPASSQ